TLLLVMKEEEIPQDKRNFRDGEKLNKLVYATDANGNYIGKNSSGWDPEIEATKVAWNAVEEQLEEAKTLYRQGEVSPIYYYMVKTLMDVGVLAKYMGKWEWQIKRHFKTSTFKSLSDKALNKYAEVFGVTVDEL